MNLKNKIIDNYFKVKNIIMNKKILISIIFVSIFFLSTNQAIAYNGVCGTADGATLPYSATSWGGLTACEIGAASGFSWPGAGKTVNYSCLGGGIPVGTNDSCSVSREAFVCSTASNCSTKVCQVASCSSNTCSYTNAVNGTSCSGGVCYSGSCVDPDTSSGACSASGNTWFAADDYFNLSADKNCCGNDSDEYSRPTLSSYQSGGVTVYCTPSSRNECTNADSCPDCGKFVPAYVSYSDYQNLACSDGWTCVKSQNAGGFASWMTKPCSGAPVISSFTATTPITLGQSTTLTYTVSGNATACTASTTSTGAGTWTGTKGYIDGTYVYSDPPTITPTTTGTKTYKISCSNTGGTVEKTVDVVVNNTTTTCLTGYFLYNGVCTANPIGFYDEPLTCTNGTLKAVGWAFDGNDVPASINVNFYNGTTATTLLGSVLANQSSADVTAYFATLGQTVTGNHRFVWERTGMAAGTYTVSAFAQNTGAGANTNLGAKTVTCGTTPPPTYSCSPSSFSNATICSGDDTVTANTTSTLVSACTTATKCEFTCNSGYSLSGGACVADVVTYSCTNMPTGGEAWDSEENDGLSADKDWVYAVADTSVKCQYKCKEGYVRYNNTCVAGPTLSFYITKPAPTEQKYIKKPENYVHVDGLILGSSAEFTYKVAGTTTYPTTSCEASVTPVGGGNWTGAQSYSDGTHVSPPIQPSAIGNYTYTLTCYNSVGAYTTRTVGIRVIQSTTPNNPPTAEIFQPTALDAVTLSSTGPVTFEGRGTGLEAGETITDWRWFNDPTACTALDPTAYTSIFPMASTFPYTFPSDGTYNFCLRVKDSRGAWSLAPDNLAITINIPIIPTYGCVNLNNCSLPGNCGNPVPLTCTDGSNPVADSFCNSGAGCGNTTCSPCPTTPPTGNWKEVTPS